MRLKNKDAKKRRWYLHKKAIKDEIIRKRDAKERKQQQSNEF